MPLYIDAFGGGFIAIIFKKYPDIAFGFEICDLFGIW